MPLLANPSIKTKLILLTMTSAGAALVLCCTAFIVNHVRTLHASKQAQLQSLVDMLAFNSTGVLSFRDAPAGRQLLASLRLQPTVKAACLYDGEGRVLASWSPHGLGASPAPPAIDEFRFEGGQIEIFRRVVDHGEDVGALYLRASAADLREQLARYAVIAFCVMLFALAASVAISSRLQDAIARPILRLAETAAKITSTGDYSLRVEHGAGDELGALYQATNRMLERIDASDKALKAAHEELELRVVERTAQLRAEIQQRERAQRELEQAKNVAEEANRAKSRFLANMSHEIRTPLNAILGFTDLLLRGADQGSRQERDEYLAIIHSSGKHLLALINDILDLSKIEAGKLTLELTRFSPLQLLEEIVSVLRVRAQEKGLTLEWEWPDGVPEMVYSDPERLRQLLVNLISNAIKFTERGGVRIVGRVLSADGCSRLMLQVIDSGIGIPREKWESIFDPFVQADNSVTRKYGGTGLGLAISRRIVTALGGELTVQSEVGRGSEFTATFDCGSVDGLRSLDPVRMSRYSSDPPGERETIAALPPARILLVEDGETNRRLVSIVLKRVGAEVVAAENGRVGVELARQQPFDMILMDMQMPVMDGYTAAMLLRKEGARLPIIALTAHAMKGDELKCREAGCSDYLAKPIDADRLLRTVRRWLDRRESRCELSSAAADPSGPGNSPQDALQPFAPPTAPAAAGAPCPDAFTAFPTPLVSTLPLDDPEFREIVAEFVERFQRQFDQMRQALQQGDFEELRRLAHWLKGSGGTAGFAALTETARRLERATIDRQLIEITQTLGELADLSRRIAVPCCEDEPRATTAGG